MINFYLETDEIEVNATKGGKDTSGKKKKKIFGSNFIYFFIALILNIFMLI